METTAQVDRIAAALPNAATRPWSRQRLASAGLAALIAGAGSWYGYRWGTEGRFLVSTDDAYVGGEVTALAPKAAGFIAVVAVADNQFVHAGDLLVRLDDRDDRAVLAKAEALVAGQRATLANLDASRRVQLARVAEAQAGIAAAVAENARARDDQARYRDLVATAAASIQSFQKADADYKQAVAADQRAHAALEGAERQLEVIEAEKLQAQAALAAAEADRETARLNLSYTELRAPFDGVIGNRSARQGAYAAVGAALLAVAPAKGLWIEANFRENQLAQMRPGQAATIEADALPGRVFHGHVDSLAPATGAVFSVLPAENATGNFTKIVQRVPVRIVLDGAAGDLGPLRPGLSVTAAVDLRRGD